MRKVNPFLLPALMAACLLGAKDAPAREGAMGAAAEAPAAQLPDSSLYQLASRWQSDQGSLRLADLRGKVRILTLFFGHCESSCPMVLGKLKALEDGQKGNAGKAMGFVLVSLDPARDDIPSLTRFRTKAGLSKEAWTLLRGSEPDTRELAMMLGVRYRPSAANGGVEHDAIIAILDPQGRILKRYDGTVSADSMAVDLRKAIQAASIPAR